MLELLVLVYATGGNIQEPILVTSDQDARQWVEAGEWNPDDDVKLYRLRDGEFHLVANYKDVF